MRIRFFIFLLMSFAPHAFADNTTPQLEKASAYFRLSGMESMYTDKEKVNAMLEGMMNELKQAAAQRMTPAQNQELNRRLAGIMPSVNQVVIDYFARMQPEMIQLLANTYTEEELDALIKFYSSPEGKKIVSKSLTVVRGMTDITQQHSQLLSHEIYTTIISHIQAVMSGKMQ